MESKLTLLQSAALNTLNMFGTGPFVSLPLLIASVSPPGPQALFGYVVALVACIADSFIWSELASIYPDSGGTYVYLKKCYGEGWGQLMSFLFVWQQVVSGPMEIATGFSAISRYATYLYPLNSLQQSALSSCLAVATVALLYRGTDAVGAITIALWVGTLTAIFLTLAAGISGGDPALLHQDVPLTPTFFFSAASAMRYSIYDLMGYYDVCYVADKVENPRKNIPIACISTCVIVGVVFVAVDCSIMSATEWHGETGLLQKIERNDPSLGYLMSDFAERNLGGVYPAMAFTVLVMYTIFGSSFSLMYGYAQIPYSAAKQGDFFSIFAHSHPTYSGLCDWSLLLTGALSVVFCWFDLDTVIEGLIATRILSQFIAQTVGLMIHRKHAGTGRPHFKMPLYPLPCVVQIVLFLVVFVSSDSLLLGGGKPILEGALVVLFSGLVVFLALSKTRGVWPFRDSGLSKTRCTDADSYVVHKCALRNGSHQSV